MKNLKIWTWTWTPKKNVKRSPTTKPNVTRPKRNEVNGEEDFGNKLILYANALREK